MTAVDPAKPPSPPNTRAERAHLIGSAFDERQQPRRSSRRRQRRRLQRVWYPIIDAAGVILPLLLHAYCWFVWKTSRVEDRFTPQLFTMIDKHDRCVCPMWHQQVGTVAFGYAHFRGHTLAAPGHFGRIITRMLERAGYVVFRGRGRAKGGQRRGSEVLQAMVTHMLEEPRVVYGITCDGSRGPRFVVKPGVAVIARDCRAPTLVVQTAFSRRIELPTWDRTVLPLPFGRIVIDGAGPYWIDPDASRDEVEAFRAHIERELRELHDHCHRLADRRPRHRGPAPVARVEAPRWHDGSLGAARTAHDLRTDAPPPWAHRAEPGTVDRSGWRKPLWR